MLDVIWFVRYAERDEAYFSPQLCRFVPANGTLLATMSYTDGAGRAYYQTKGGHYIEVYDVDSDGTSCDMDSTAAEVAEVLLMSNGIVDLTEAGEAWLEEQKKNAVEV